MASGSTTRGAFPYPLQDRTDSFTIAEDLKQLADRIALICVLFDKGVIGSRPAAGTAGKGWIATDTLSIAVDDGSAWREMLPGRETRLSVAADSSGPALPGSPLAGDRCLIHFDGQDGAYFQTMLGFAYDPGVESGDPSPSSKWVNLSGAGLLYDQYTSATTTADGAWHLLPLPLQAHVPYAGVYDVELRAAIQDTQQLIRSVQLAVQINSGSLPAVDANGARTLTRMLPGGSIAQLDDVHGRLGTFILAAGDLVKFAYKQSGTVGIVLGDKSLTLIPRRIG